VNKFCIFSEVALTTAKNVLESPPVFRPMPQDVQPPIVDLVGEVKEKAHSTSDAEADAVRLELGHIFQSPQFHGSKRCQDFLEYVVEQTLAGLPHGLKERTIGVAVFGRANTYDTNEDGIVRMKASEVRKRLALYHADGGKNAAVCIELPVGSYVPTFCKRPADEPESSAALSTWNLVSATEDVAPKWKNQGKLRTQRSWRIWGTIFAVLSAIALCTGSWFELRPSPAVLDQFWAPLLQSPSPVVLAAAYGQVYMPTRPPAVKDFTLLTDQYVGGGDLVAASWISGLLGRRGHPFTVKIGNAVSFEDLHNAPAILIGYSSNQWKEMTKDFRFFIDDENGIITDNGKPTEWYPHHLSQDFHTDDDYAIISRAFYPQTNEMMMLVSGCEQYGTQAAAELITNPGLLAKFLQGAPNGWQKKNLQFVIHVRVIANSPASPEVVASYYW
jgi:hypothetical protein